MSWNVGNMLIDNPKKTEIIHLTFYIAPEPVPAIKTGDCSITPSSEVKGLGVTLDRLFTFKIHIENICRSLHVLFTTSEKLGTFLRNVLFVHLFFFKLDFRNSILHGLPSYELEKLQRLQNTTARLTVRAKMSACHHFSLKSLHWLPVKEIIIFKIFLVTYKILHGFAPAYLNELHHRLLRSSSLPMATDPSQLLHKSSGMTQPL